MNKKELIKGIEETLQAQLSELNSEVLSVNDEIGKETKSSAGDKFETSREMMNQERNRLEERMAHLKKLLNVLQNIDPTRTHSEVENGSLVETEKITFFFGLAFGKFMWEKEEVMVLSLNSPIGKAFLSKKEGDIVSFMKNRYHIKSIC